MSVAHCVSILACVFVETRALGKAGMSWFRVSGARLRVSSSGIRVYRVYRVDWQNLGSKRVWGFRSSEIAFLFEFFARVRS